MSRRRCIAQLASIFAGVLPRDPDWIGVLEIANQELITAELYDRLRQSEAINAIPKDLLVFLEDVDKRVAERMARLSDTLFDALKALNAAAIAPLLLKGSYWLAMLDPCKPGLARRRIVADLDLLVEPAELHAAVDALRLAGFTVIEDDRHAMQHNVVVMARPSDVGAIDLHQMPPGPPGIVGLDLLHSRSLAITYRGLAARISTSEDQILLLAAHDQFQDGHFWRGGFNFRHLVDIARLASGPAQVDWTALLAMCRSSIARTAVVAQLAAARSLTAAAVPSHLPRSSWGRLHYWRQRAQLTWPLINRPFNRLGLDKNVWRNISARRPS